MAQGSRTSLEQLRNAFAAGAIDRATYDVAVAAIVGRSEQGATAQGRDAIAVGAGGVAIQGNNTGIVNLGLIIELGRTPGATPNTLRRAYLARILVQANQVPLFASDTASAQIRLSSVYTALLTQRSEPDRTIEGAVEAVRPSREREDRRLSALDVLDRERKLVLLGGPGSGKSSFVNIVALSMAGELLGDPRSNLESLAAPLPHEEGERESEKPQRWSHDALIPVEIVLRDLASQLPPQGTDVTAETVWSFIAEQLNQAALADFAPVLHHELLERGGLVLLDGLDEVPDAYGRRSQIKQGVQDFAATFSKCRFLVTSRTYAYQRQQWKLDGFAEAYLSPFTKGQMHRFVDAWYAHMVELLRLTQVAAGDRGDILKRAVAGSERLRELAERPLLLTLIAQLQTEGGGTLPEKREELYDRAVEMLLNKWESMKVRVRSDGTREAEPSLAEWLNAGRDDIRKQLNRLAFDAHRKQPHLVGTADIRQATLVDALLKASASHADVKVKRLEEYLRDRAGILAAHGIEMYQFPHRSFQEYLAACHLTDDEFPEKLAGLVRDDPNRWREVALLAGAKASRGSMLSAWALAESLCVAPPPDGAASEADHWSALIAGRVVVECADVVHVAPRNTEKIARIREWQRTIMRRNTLPAVERALAGRTLAALGDPRPEVMTLDGMQFCFVPPGPFEMGENHGTKDVQPQHMVQMPYPYFIGRFPVTVAQWREYVERRPTVRFEPRALAARDNDPVAPGTWHEAVAFCEALTEAWRGWLPAGFIVTLPSEAEWEKAARGGTSIPTDWRWISLSQVADTLAKPAPQTMRNPFPGRTYAWGESFDVDKANAGPSVSETSAVGCYPTGVSPYGCEEMCGNVWEWTRSLWGSDLIEPQFRYPYSSSDSTREDLHAPDDIRRVLRGGSHDLYQVVAHCAFRLGLFPGTATDVGFRVVLRASGGP